MPTVSRKLVKVLKSPKQKCLELCEQYSWLRVEKDDDWYYGEMRIDVYDINEANQNDDYFAAGSDGDYCCFSWKEAHERALELTKERS